MDDRYYRFKKFGNEAPNDSFFNAFQENLTGPYQKTTLDTEGTPIITKHFGDRKNVYYEPKAAEPVSEIHSNWFIVYAKNYTELRVAPLRISGPGPYNISKGKDYAVYPMVWKDVPGAYYSPWEPHWEVEGYGDSFNSDSLVWERYSSRSYCTDSVKYFIKSFNINVVRRNSGLETIVNRKLYLIGTTLYLNNPTGKPLDMLKESINDSRIDNTEQYRFRNMYNDIMMFYIYDPATNNLVDLGYTRYWYNNYNGVWGAWQDYDWSEDYFYITDRYRPPYGTTTTWLMRYRIVMEGGILSAEMIDYETFGPAYDTSPDWSAYYVSSAGAVFSPVPLVSVLVSVTDPQVFPPVRSWYTGYYYGPYTLASIDGAYLKRMEPVSGNLFYNPDPPVDEVVPFYGVINYAPGVLFGKDFDSCFKGELNLPPNSYFANDATWYDPYGTTYIAPGSSNWQWVFSSFAHVGDVFLQAYGRVSDDSGSYGGDMLAACPVSLMKAYINGHSIEQQIVDGCGISLENIRAIIYLPGKS